MWERWKMARDGLLRDDFPHGTWEIATTGKTFYRDMRKK